MNDMRACSECGQPQEWCDLPSCSWPIPRGHWTHMEIKNDEDCPNLGDRNRVPGAAPDLAWMADL